jgi:zinc protease
MLRRGTKTRSAIEIDEAFGNFGSNISGMASREQATMGTEVLSRDMDAAMGIMADVVMNPSFPADEFEKEKQLTLDGLKQAENNPNAVSNRVSAMIAFGPDHPYGRPLGGLPGTVAAITREDLVKFHKERWRPGSSLMIFVGDVTLADAVTSARKHFGSWSGGAAPAVNVPAKRPMPTGKVYLVDRQGAAQTVVAHILTAPERKSPDYYALSLANALTAYLPFRSTFQPEAPG